MKLRDLIFEMGNSLLSSKLRTALTMTGLIIGIVSVLVMLAAVQGVQNMVINQMGGSRATVVSFSAYEPYGAITISKKDDRIAKDIEYLKKTVPNVKEIGVNAFADFKLSSAKKTINSYGMVLDTVAGEMNSTNLPGKGRLITPEEFESGAPVMVITHNDAQTLFEDADKAVGQRVKFGNTPIQIVGVFPQGGMMGGGSNIIPLRTIERRIPGAFANFNSFEVAFNEESQVKEGAEMLKRVYQARYPNLSDDNMFTFAYTEMLNEVRQFTQVFSILALLIASTSLSVGGIGIMNMMLTNVTERTREIGLRKAVGAKGSSITWQFLFEAIAVCLSGNLVAVIVSYALVIGAKIIAPMISNSMAGFEPVITWWALLISVGVSTFIALVFGWYPARRASKLDPIEALRYQ